MAKDKGTDSLQYINMIKNSPSKNVEYIFMGATFVLSVILIVFAIKPTVDTVLTINKEIKQKGTTLEALDNKINALSQLDQQYMVNEQKFEDLTLIYPTAGNFSLFLSNIDAVTSRNSYILNSVNFSEHDDEAYDISTSVLEPWSVRLSVSGKKSNFQNLLKDLEAMPMYPVIERLSYSDDVDEEGNTTYSLSLRIYHIDNNLFYD